MGESNHFHQPRENFLSSLKVLLAFISLVSCVTVWNVLLPCLKKNIQSPESTKLFLLNPSLLPWHLKELQSRLIWFHSFSNPARSEDLLFPKSSQTDKVTLQMQRLLLAHFGDSRFKSSSEARNTHLYLKTDTNYKNWAVNSANSPHYYSLLNLVLIYKPQGAFLTRKEIL